MSKFDPSEWAKTVKTKFNKCQTCQLPEVANATHVVLEMIATGKALPISVNTMWMKWIDEYKYPYSYTTLKGHVVRCERELWSKIRGQKTKK